jgi:ubiquinone/menaquinone biosynthesis C-methylase UbiE
VKRHRLAIALLVVVCAVTAAAQSPPRYAPSAAELRQAEIEVPKLIDVLELQPGMSVADIGAGFGAMVTVLARTLGPTSRIYATDVAERQLEVLRRDRVESVTVVEGGERSANLPEACCDAIYMRDVYHHFTHPDDVNRSLRGALKPGGRLAIIDFEARAGSPLPDGVNPNRLGHGIPPRIVQEEVARAGLTFDRLISKWPDQQGNYFLVLFRNR